MNQVSIKNLLIITVLSVICLVGFAQSNAGIKGQSAPEWNIDSWYDLDGNRMDDVKLSDQRDKVIFLLCFQSWCPGCHSTGFPTLTQVIDAYRDNDRVQFYAIQTVFEGHSTNTAEKIAEVRTKYGLEIPIGHDAGNDENGNRSTILKEYKTGGTPWIIVIDRQGTVAYNNYRLAPEKAIELIKRLLD